MMDLNLNSYSGRLPTSGMMLNGIVSEHQMSVRHTSESDGSAYLTPLKADGRRGSQCKNVPRNGLTAQVLYPTPVKSDATMGAIIGEHDTYRITSTGMPRKVNQNGHDGSVGLGRLANCRLPSIGNDRVKRSIK